MKKRIISALMVSSVVLGTVVLPIAVLADDVDNKIEQSDKKISELSNQEAAASEVLASVKANIDTIRAEAGILQAEQAKLNKEVAQLAADIETLANRIQKRDETIKEQARQVQVDGVASNYIDAVLTSESVSSAITRVAAASKLVSASNDLMKQQEEDKIAVETKKATTETKVAQVNENASKLEAKKGELVDQELQQQALVSEVAALRTNEEGKKAGFLQEKAAAEAARAEQARLAKEAEDRAIAEAQAAEVAQNAPVAQTDNPGTGGGQVAPGTGGGQVAPGTGGGQVTPPNNVGGGGSVTPPTQPAQPNTPAPTPPPAANPSGGAIVAEAAKHIGKPYVWGGKGPSSFDCSGLTAYVFRAAAGREIGGYTVPQESAGTRIAVSQAQAGDLYFWGPAGGTHHVAIATGGGGYIHAPQPGQNVGYGSVGGWAPDFAVRVL